MLQRGTDRWGQVLQSSKGSTGRQRWLIDAEPAAPLTLVIAAPLNMLIAALWLSRLMIKVMLGDQRKR